MITKKRQPRTPLSHVNETRWQRAKRLLSRDRYLILLIVTGFLCLFIFSYLPMFGLVTAFQDYSPGRPFFFGAEWVGLKWFKQFFESVYFGRLMRNTFLLSFYSIIFTFPIPIIFALLLNEARTRRYKKFIQTVSYFPHFISTVIIVGIMLQLLGTDGVIYNLVNFFAPEEIKLLGNAQYFRSIYIISDIWACFGWDAIIYVAALSSVDVQLYEAATVDGANRWDKLWHITLPALQPTIVIQLILKMGSMFAIGAEKVMLLYSPAIYDTADVISTYVYRRGILEQSYSFGTAVGLFNGLISLVFVIATNYICKKLNDVSLW